MPSSSSTGGTEPWRALRDEERAVAYSPSSEVSSMADELRRAASASHRVREELPPVEHSYGPGARHRLDLFHPGGEHAVPVLVLVHGGYWQEESKENACAPAAQIVAAGAAFIALEYTLAPEASLAEIVEECRRGLAWILDHAAELGVDPARVHLAGSSAGAHLALMMLLGSAAGTDAARAPIRSATLLSGIYDLRPLVGTYVNDPLGLDETEAWRLSPQALIGPSSTSLLVTWAQHDTREFARQGHEFATSWRAAGNRADEIADIPGRNHFDLPLDLADPATPLGRAVHALLRIP